jgi:hypothetical protein
MVRVVDWCHGEGRGLEHPVEELIEVSCGPSLQLDASFHDDPVHRVAVHLGSISA